MKQDEELRNQFSFTGDDLTYTADLTNPRPKLPHVQVNLNSDFSLFEREPSLQPQAPDPEPQQTQINHLSDLLTRLSEKLEAQSSAIELQNSRSLEYQKTIVRKNEQIELLLRQQTALSMENRQQKQFLSQIRASRGLVSSEEGESLTLQADEEAKEVHRTLAYFH
jgi:hypothetical protein